MRIENDTDAAGVAEVVAAFVSGTLNDLIHSTGGLAKPQAFRAAWAARGDGGLLGPHLPTAHELSGEEIRRRTFDELPRYAVPIEISARGAAADELGKLDRRAIQRAWRVIPMTTLDEIEVALRDRVQELSEADEPLAADTELLAARIESP